MSMVKRDIFFKIAAYFNTICFCFFSPIAPGLILLYNTLIHL